MQVTISPADAFAKRDALKFIDASWYLPTQNLDGYQEYLSAHIPGAQFFDIDQIADPRSDLPHMAPSAEEFGNAVGAMGISNSDTIVVYDGAGLFSAARVWFLFRAMGHEHAFILDGGLPAWIEAGHPTVSGEEISEPTQFTAKLNTYAFVTAEDLYHAEAQVLDARPLARFKGEAEEPRPGTRKGHIPSSKSLFFGDLLKDGKLKSSAELTILLAERGISIEAPTITTCGSGVTAAVLAAAFAKLGKEDVQIYDGSWAEWGARQDLPIATGDS